MKVVLMLELEEADYIQILQAAALVGKTTQAFIMDALKNEIRNVREVVALDGLRRDNTVEKDSRETTTE